MWKGVYYKLQQEKCTVPFWPFANWCPKLLLCLFQQHHYCQAHSITRWPPAQCDSTMRKIKSCKAAGPDEIAGGVLKDCACQLSEVMSGIFNISLSQAIVPTCLKTSTIFPDGPSVVSQWQPSRCTHTSNNENIWEVGWFSLECLQVEPLYNQRNISCDPPHSHTPGDQRLMHQVALSGLLFWFHHNHPPDTGKQTGSLGLVPLLCNWILDFLTNRPQSVRISNITSAPIILNTGSHKAVFSAHFSTHCLLMPAELTITATVWWSSWMKQQWWDSSPKDRTQEVSRLWLWYKQNNLILIIHKSRELMVSGRDFRKRGCTPPPLFIDSTAEIGHSFKYTAHKN